MAIMKIIIMAKRQYNVIMSVTSYSWHVASANGCVYIVYNVAISNGRKLISAGWQNGVAINCGNGVTLCIVASVAKLNVYGQLYGISANEKHRAMTGNQWHHHVASVMAIIA